MHSPVKPRLALEALDSFFDEGILRLIEGMIGVPQCTHYEFLEVRSIESGYKGHLRALANTQVTTKKLEMVYENMIEKAEHLTKENKREKDNGKVSV